MQEIVDRTSTTTIDDIVNTIEKSSNLSEICIVAVHITKDITKMLIGLVGPTCAWIDINNPLGSIQQYASVREALYNAKNNKYKLFIDRCNMKTMLNRF